MPVLGADGAQSSPSRRAATAYSSGGSSRNNWGSVVGLILTILLVRNLLFHDYRADEINQLTKSGKTMDEIRAYIPETVSEKREKKRKEGDTMKQLVDDVVTLKEEVRQLRSSLNQKIDASKQDLDQGGKSFDKIRFEEEEEGQETEKRTLKEPGVINKQTEKTRQTVTSKEIEDKGSVPEGDLLGSP